MLSLLSRFAASCGGGSFLGFPHWYQYLNCQTVKVQGQPTQQLPQLDHINDIWLIVAAIIEILLRVAGIAAIILVIWGGAQYMTSQGEPDKTNKAKTTIMNALIGLLIAILAAAIVDFIAGRFG